MAHSLAIPFAVRLSKPSLREEQHGSSEFDFSCCEIANYLANIEFVCGERLTEPS